MPCPPRSYEPCGGYDPECAAHDRGNDRGRHYSVDSHDLNLAPTQLTLLRGTRT